MEMSLSADFDVGEHDRQDVIRFELVQQLSGDVEIRVRHESVGCVDKDQLVHIGAMIEKMIKHLESI